MDVKKHLNTYNEALKCALYDNQEKDTWTLDELAKSMNVYITDGRIRLTPMKCGSFLKLQRVYRVFIAKHTCCRKSLYLLKKIKKRAPRRSE